MAHPDVEQAFRDRLAEGFTGCELVDDGAEPNVEGFDPFLTLQFPFVSSSQITTGSPGSNFYREEGAARFVLSVRRNKPSIAEGKQWCVEIAALFRGKHFGGVRTYAPNSPVSDDGNDMGGFYVLAFTCPFDFDVVG